MPQLVWSDTASRDLDRIYDYIARDSLKYALRTVSRVKQAAESAARMSEVGSIVPEYDVQQSERCWQVTSA